MPILLSKTFLYTKDLKEVLMSSEERYIVFSATGTNVGIVNTLDALARNMIIKHFPPNFFTGGVHIDTKTGIRDMYRNERQLSMSNNNENVSKIKRPRISIAYNWQNFDTKETGLGPAAFGQYPNTHVVRKDLRGYWRFLEDKDTGISLHTSDLRIKIDFDVIIDVNTRDDQVSMMNFLYNIIKFNRTHWYKVNNAKFTLPQSLMYGIYRCLYGNVPADQCALEFGEWTKSKSNGGVVQEFMNGNQKKSFFRMIRDFANLSVTMNGEPTMGDPESKDLAYDKFSITFSGSVEPYIPISYIFHSPDKIKNTFVNNALFISNNTDDFDNYTMRYFSRMVRDVCSRNSPSFHTRMRKVIDEEFYIDEPTLDQDFSVLFSEDWNKVIEHLSIEDVNKIFDVRFYENGVYLDKDLFIERIIERPEDKFRYLMKDCDPTKDYTIFIHCDDKELQFIAEMKNIKL